MEHSANAARSQQTVGRQRRPDLNQRLAVRRRGFGAPLLPGRSVSPILAACASGARQGSPERAGYGDRSPPSPLDLLKDFGNSTRRRPTQRRPSLVRILEDSTATPIPEGALCREEAEKRHRGSPAQTSNRAISLQSPIDVLKEFSASTRRRQNLVRPSVANPQEDKTPIKENRRNPSTSWYKEASNNPSPIPDYNDEDTMHCAEAFLLPKTPTQLTSPLARKNRRQRSVLRSNSDEATLYIDHLESQLASAQTQLEVYTSPATTNIASTELRKLKEESEMLRREVQDWEAKFEGRVEEEVKARVESETRLKAKIAKLENEVTCRDERVVELEEELEGAQRRVKELERGSRFVVARAKQIETLEAANQDLEGRVDVLTGLLAHSQSLATTPSSPDGTVARTLPPRPRSMGEFGTAERRMRRFHSGACTLKTLILPGAVEEPLWSGKSLAEELHGVGEEESMESVSGEENNEVGSPSPHRSLARRVWDAWRRGTQMVRRILGSIWKTLPLQFRRFRRFLLGLFFYS